MKSLQWVALIQGAYFAITGVWPLIHLRSFMAVTGPKTDRWLVRTVGVLILGIGLTIAMAGWRDRVSAEIALLAIFSALALAAVDVIYVTRRVIDKIYLADAVAELILVVLWFAAYR